MRAQPFSPLYASQNSGYIVRWTPSVLQDIQAELTRAVYVWVKHLADELDARRLVWVCLLKVHHQPERPILKRCICRSDDYSVPVIV